MSSLAFLVTELQSLASETRRKHPDIREAAEKSLVILRASPEQANASLISDGPQTNDLLSPIFMGCSTKNAKVVAISLGSLQRLISLKAVPPSQVSKIVGIMSDAMTQGVDIQLKILQTLVLLIMNFKDVHGEELGDALLLCFKLQESKIAVVSSTAAATLRQLVMFVVDKMVEEDRSGSDADTSSVVLPDGTTIDLLPSAHDAFYVFSDLCLLANSEAPSFLKLTSLPKTFALELIESVLTNYHTSFREHPELILLLRHHLCPLLLKSLSSRPLFPLTLRCTRVVFILLKQFSAELETEAEVFLSLLIRIISSSSDPEDNPLWMRVLAMEIMRGLCSDAELMRNVWDRYEGEEGENDGKSNAFTSLIATLNRLVTEKPALLGVSQQMIGVNVDSHVPMSTSGSGGMAGMVATAAVGVASMMGAGAGLSLQTSAMKLQCIDQLDKADAPPIPESYIYLLAVQCIVSLCEGFASFTGPLYTQFVIQRPRAAGDAPNRAPPALDLSTLPHSPTTTHLHIVRSIISSGWPALLAALSFVLSTNLSSELFIDVLAAYQSLTNVSGMLGLSTPRDAFLTYLAKFAVPTRVITALDAYEGVPQTPRSTVAEVAENFGLAASTGPPTLSERNMMCLKMLLASAMFLAGSLGESWSGVLEVVQNAEYVLTYSVSAGSGAVGSPKKGRAVSGSAASTQSPTSSTRHPMLNDLDPHALLAVIQRLFDASKNLEDPAFRDFVDALCKLSRDMVEIGSETFDGASVVSKISMDSESLGDDGGLASPTSQHRRLSGIHIPRAFNSRSGAGDFGISKLGEVAKLNLHRLIYRPPAIAWDQTTSHLLFILSLPTAPQTIRLQAARVLDDILQTVPRNLGSTGDVKAVMQQRVLSVLREQVMPHNESVGLTVTGVEVRKMGLETLHEILQGSGHTLVVGWEIIFEMLESVCRLSSPPSSEKHGTKPMVLGLGLPSEKSLTSLIKIAFQSLTLVCDSVTSLSPEHLRLCIRTLGEFGKQSDTNIALTAAASLLWSVSDTIQGKRKDKDEESKYSELWMFLLLEILGLCTDVRQEVRDGAIQTLFRAIKLYGGTLSVETWDECIWMVTFPLLHKLNDMNGEGYDDSKILALQSIAGILHDFFVDKILKLDKFDAVWDGFVAHVEGVLGGIGDPDRKVAVAALRCAEKAIKATSRSPSSDVDERAKVRGMYERAWVFIDSTGEELVQRTGRSFTQEILVAFVDVIQCTRVLSRAFEEKEWELERIQKLMVILKGVLTYPHSPDYRPDIDALPPVQTVVMDTVASIDLSVPGSPSLIMRDLSEYTILAFLAAFDVPSTTTTSTPKKRVTYIALTKRTMPMLVDLFVRYKTSREIYVDGTLESVLASYAIPVKLKYDCPSASKYDTAKVLPLWKTATECFLKIVKEVSSNIGALSEDSGIPDERVEGIWRQVLDVYRGGILADCTPALALPLSVQLAEESFDLALVSSLEIDVVPHLGDSRLPDSLVGMLGNVLEKGSRVYNDEHESASRRTSSSTEDFVHVLSKYEHGTTESGNLLPREQFAYWCFDLLFLVCSSITQDSREQARRRLAALSLPSLLRRCGSTMGQYVADERVRGNLPFPRAREDELVYVLRKLEQLRLWDGCLWSAMSERPSDNTRPKLDISMPSSQIIAEAVKCSTVAHLFHFYTVLCEIVSIPRRTPGAWVVNDGNELGKGAKGAAQANNTSNEIDVPAERVDARDLARQCLIAAGREMGVPL